jgi:glyoxalase-like protein
MAFPIDHLISLTQDREGARAFLTRMGFDLTERGEHPGRGTSNHLAFFGRCYWELLAVDTPTPENAALHERGSGLAGCALRTDDAQRDGERARTLGDVASDPESFTRPVRLDGEWKTARFRTVVLRPPTPVDAYLFFCQHLTPELVWPRETRDHPNGAFRIQAVTVVAPTAPEARSAIEPLLGTGGGTEPELLYDSAPVARPQLASLTLQVREVDRCEAWLAGHGIAFERGGGALRCHAPHLGHSILFSA